MMKKKMKYFVMLLAIIVTIFITSSVVLADFGDFESYDSGGSSWGGSSDWGSSSSSWDYDSDYSGVGNIFFFLGSGGGIGSFIIFAIFVGITIWKEYNRKNGRTQSYRPTPQPNYQNNQNNEISAVDSKWAEEGIKAVDENFSKDDFLLWVKDVFVKMQTAWMKRDLSTLRVLQEDRLYEQSKLQVQGYIDRKQINMIERICVEAADLMKFRQSGNKDVMEVKLKSKMQDYIIDEDTKKIIRGKKDVEIRSTYKLTFIRTSGVKTKTGDSKLNTTNCPNCGAPTEISSSGKCEYCGSVITTGEFGWILSSIEKLV